MARVQLDLPEQFLYTHTINVRMTDLNTGKHVGNDQMISLLSEARYRFSAISVLINSIATNKVLS